MLLEDLMTLSLVLNGVIIGFCLGVAVMWMVEEREYKKFEDNEDNE